MPKQIVVASGSPATGKSTLTAFLAGCLETPSILADCDVESSRLPHLMNATLEEERVYASEKVGLVTPEKCEGCGLCIDACRFDAFVREDGRYCVDAAACEGCCLCALVCPNEAIRMREKERGRLFLSRTASGPLVHGQLELGHENWGSLVATVKNRAHQLAWESGAEVILVDGCAVNGCAFVAATSGARLVLTVADSSPEGLRGLERLLGLTSQAKIPCAVCVNKDGLQPDLSAEIEFACSDRGVPVVGRIPYDPVLAEAGRQGLPLPKTGSSPARKAFSELAARIRDFL